MEGHKEELQSMEMKEDITDAELEAQEIDIDHADQQVIIITTIITINTTIININTIIININTTIITINTTIININTTIININTTIIIASDS